MKHIVVALVLVAACGLVAAGSSGDFKSVYHEEAGSIQTKTETVGNEKYFTVMGTDEAWIVIRDTSFSEPAISQGQKLNGNNYVSLTLAIGQKKICACYDDHFVEWEAPPGGHCIPVEGFTCNECEVVSGGASGVLEIGLGSGCE